MCPILKDLANKKEAKEIEESAAKIRKMLADAEAQEIENQYVRQTGLANADQLVVSGD